MISEIVVAFIRLKMLSKCMTYKILIKNFYTHFYTFIFIVVVTSKL